MEVKELINRGHHLDLILTGKRGHGHLAAAHRGGLAALPRMFTYLGTTQYYAVVYYSLCTA